MNWKGKNVLITGISGFVGPYLAEELLKRGARVFGLIRKRADGTKPKNLVDRGIVDNVHLLEGDLTDITSLANALDKSQADVIFHLAAQSYVARSFQNPIETQQINCLGTANLLEAIRMKDLDPVIVFAGSSEEYGLVIFSEKQYQKLKERYKVIFPEPEKIPELPIKETNPLRPMSPYAVSKVYGDYLMRNYHHSYGLKTIVSRAFNHEGAGRGLMFVTSVITNQVMKLKFGEVDKIVIGNVNAFRDWSHVKDIVDGYILIAEKGKYGDVYNQGSMRTNSILSYILLSLEEAGYEIKKIETVNGEKVVKKPTEIDNSGMFGVKFEKAKIDKMLLDGEIEYTMEDKGIIVDTDKGKILIEFDPKRFRPAEVPVLMSDTTKIQELGFKVKYKIKDIIKDQLNYFLKKENRL
ncbi:GDP-mannose 4,6-dehydratase [Caldisericum sp.]|jgi:GDPmannose 4,6-dehydratase|uniref:GDP-mannose 4,6-dehydratase n=1 Tax=Caldisericum sp. TaxID=2499687 RepID=UPI003D140D59